VSTEAFSIHKPRGFLGPGRSGGCTGADWLRGICSPCFIWSGTNAVYVTTGSTSATSASVILSSELARGQQPRLGVRIISCWTGSNPRAEDFGLGCWSTSRSVRRKNHLCQARAVSPAYPGGPYTNSTGCVTFSYQPISLPSARSRA